MYPPATLRFPHLSTAVDVCRNPALYRRLFETPRSSLAAALRGGGMFQEGRGGTPALFPLPAAAAAAAAEVMAKVWLHPTQQLCYSSCSRLYHRFSGDVFLKTSVSREVVLYIIGSPEMS